MEIPIVLHLMPASGGLLTATYLRPLNSADANYSLWQSSNLASWAPASGLIVGQTLTPVVGNLEMVTITLVYESAPSSRFFRVQKLTP